MDFWQRYRAIDARDTRFDGQFYTAVRTTGIYCRPSCPARTPKEGNVTFYETSAAAHDAGYRACKRCLPEAVPGTPAWNLRSDIAGRAMRLINDGVVNRDGVEGLASRLGYSSRQLNRILTHELGAGPLSLARASRAQTARTLLVSTEMPMADIAFAAGFSSVRQFNGTIGEVFAMTPSALRATARHRRAPTEATTALTLNLPYREPFDPGVFSFLAVRAIPGIEEGTSRSYGRTLRLAHGDARFRVEYDADADGRPLVLTVGAVDLRDLASLLSRVRRLLDLDADPLAIDEALAADPRLAASVARTPGIRMPGAVDPQELLIRAMIGQQITVAAARTALVQLAAAGATPSPPPTAWTGSFPRPGRLRKPASACSEARGAASTHSAAPRRQWPPATSISATATMWPDWRPNCCHWPASVRGLPATSRCVSLARRTFSWLTTRRSATASVCCRRQSRSRQAPARRRTSARSARGGPTRPCTSGPPQHRLQGRPGLSPLLENGPPRNPRPRQGPHPQLRRK